MKYPIFTGFHGQNHIQGIAVDEKNGYIYYSFTTLLVKSTLEGEIIGSVNGLTGHLGCIDFCKEGSKVYGSLEFKNDSIGKGIRERIGSDIQFDDAFYIAVFDVDKIDRLNMDAEKDGIMSAVYLKEVVCDFNAAGKNNNGCTVKHRYGCSGIDGTAFGPLPGSGSKKEYLFVAYGIYYDSARSDNDNQVILCYEREELIKYALPLSQSSLHKSGPDKPLEKYFVYTGNTNYGVQNLEYDPYTNGYFMAVYTGDKKQFPNYSLFEIDAAVPPVTKKPAGLEETHKCLTLKKAGLHKNGIYGWYSDCGTTGLYAKGDGTYLVSESSRTPEGQCSYIYEYIYSEEKGLIPRKDK